MIASLRGTVTEFRPLNDVSVEVVIEVGGVGYRVLVTTRFGATIGPVGGTISTCVHMHVREGDITLYGFSDSNERQLFEALLGAHGVGPALALAVLGALTPSELTRAINAGDLDVLTRVPGVGRKTAQRLLLDLAQRLEGFDSPTSQVGAGASDSDSVRKEVREALASLGYGVDEVRDALEQVTKGDDVQDLLRSALRVLAPHR